MPTIPPCAKRCEYVAMLLSELGVARGTSENVQRVTHGLDGEDHAPVRVRAGRDDLKEDR